MKILQYVLMLILFYGCTKDNTAIKKYITDNFHDVQSLQIIEVTEPDSTYSPYNQLLALDYFYMKASSQMAAYSLQAFEAKNKKQSTLFLDSALTLYNNITNEYDSITRKCFLAIDFPSSNMGEKNRKSVNVKYKINNGKIENQRFFFNENNNNIGHCESDIKKLAFKLIKTIDNFKDQREKIERDKRYFR